MTQRRSAYGLNAFTFVFPIRRTNRSAACKNLSNERCEAKCRRLVTKWVDSPRSFKP